MQELLLAVARGLVEDKEAVQVTVDPVRDDGFCGVKARMLVFFHGFGIFKNVVH